MEKLKRILDPNKVVLDLTAQRNFDAIRELATVLLQDEVVPDQKRLIATLIRREQQASTGIGKGVAVPHAHEDGIQRQILAIGISQAGIDFDAPDGQPVHIMALLVTPLKHQKQHMALLAALSQRLQQEKVRQRLLQAADAAEVVDIFTRNPPPG
ncbi:MAG: PTS sugar transporter subunit IIA [Gemmatimonadetes bacterium]|nr:PTS sugar transporter subunit IIA [Gemmatimonadota bacterium]MXY82983.1 PTS sugar transporter subunit IIA [Gemmatimonadota bacterium]MYB70172.1 PTS sugar transporter subunit IIA [Gemmatimonadota bacterium]